MRHLATLTGSVMYAYLGQGQEALVNVRGGGQPDFTLNRALKVRSHGRVWT
jgi:hypothetical protein